MGSGLEIIDIDFSCSISCSMEIQPESNGHREMLRGVRIFFVHRSSPFLELDVW